MKTGIELIAEERKRQIEREGWTSAHDDGHVDGEMAMAAAVYATLDTDRNLQLWPWAMLWYKPSPRDRIKELTKAGALIAAEIDRLQRLNPK